MNPASIPAHLWLLAFLFLSFSGSTHAQFTLTGTFPELAPGSTVQLFRQNLETGTKTNEGELVVKTDHSLSKIFEGESGLFHLEVSGQVTIPLAIDEGQELVIIPNPDLPSGFSIQGSPDTKLLLAYETFRKDSLDRLVYPPRAELNEATTAGLPSEKLAELAQAEVDGYQAHRRELTDFTIENIKTSIALYATSTRWDDSYRLEELKELLGEFAAQHPNLSITTGMQERFQRFLSTAIGTKAPHLKGEDLDGESITLEDFRGSTVLIDFWASWCVPCRVENKLYPELLEKYSEKGFQILGINLDTDKATWLRASRQDSISWSQISDLLGLESPMAKAYNVTALPASFLVDEKGHILGKNLRGDALEQKLEEHFEN